jgi:ABC-type branched-subunit amino acid transport system substrate-binding protein
VGGLDEANASGASASVVDADITATAGTTASDDGSLSNPTIDANDQLLWHTTSVSGVPTSVKVTVYYTYDAVN